MNDGNFDLSKEMDRLSRSLECPSIDPDTEQDGKQEERQRVRSRATVTREVQFFRRFTSERNLEDTIDWDFAQGNAYHVISGGDIDSLSFMTHILRQQKVKYLIMSTWAMALQDIEELDRYFEIGRLSAMDTYIGEIFMGTYSNEFLRLKDLHHRRGGRVAMFRNHSKIWCGFGDKFDFVIESSANVNTNPRTENTVITCNTELAKFYKDFFDGIVSFERSFDDWKPFEI